MMMMTFMMMMVISGTQIIFLIGDPLYKSAHKKGWLFLLILVNPKT